MGPRKRPYLLLSVCLLLVSDLPQTRSLCLFDEVNDCLMAKQQEMNEESVCSMQGDFINKVTGCKDLEKLQDCTEEQKGTVDISVDSITQKLTEICNQQSVSPSTTTTAEPLPECGSREGWQYANQHIADCRKSYDKLSKFEYALKLTKYGICKSSQDLLNCILTDERLNQCQDYLETFYRELIPHIKFAHLFGCELKLDGKQVARPSKKSECDFWAWLACHDSLFSALEKLQPVQDGFDLNTIIKLNVPKVMRALAVDRNNCSQFAQVDWSAIKGCRAQMSGRCSLLGTPRRDTLWYGVLGLMYQMTTQIYDKITVLTTIEDICADNCNDILTKMNKINNECKANAAVKPEDIINKFNNGKEIKDDCSKLEAVKTCLHNTVIGNCAFLEQSVVNNLHLDNNWVIAFDVCQIDLDVTSKGKCPAEQETANSILNDCSFQTNVNKREILLKNGYNSSYFCAYLQSTADCYVLKVIRCSELERKYWLAELPLMAAANQMIPQCHVRYSTNGNTELKAIAPSECDMKAWVRCLGSLWETLGVQNDDDNLSLDGFKALLRMAWNHGSHDEQMARCRKLENVDFDAIETCTEKVKMSCHFPMLTLPAAEEPALELRNPFDFGQLKKFIKKACARDCTEEDAKENFKECIDVSKDSKLLNLYPKDIIADAYRERYARNKCNDVKRVMNCVDYFLDPNKCVLFRNDIVHTSAFTEAVTLCDTPRPTHKPSSETSAAGTVVTSVVTVLLSIFFVAAATPSTSSAA